jgi:ketosteroid isomerase-like protein
MKRLLSFVGFVCLIAMLLPACAPAPAPEPEPAPEPVFDQAAEEAAVPEPVFDQAAEEAAIREFVEQWYADLNAHDIKSAFINMDENFENFSGSLKGRAANEEYWTELFEDGFKNAVYTQSEEIGIHFITPEVALYKDRYDFSGAFDKEGKPRPGKWSNGWVLVKKNGKWLVSEVIQWPIEQ